MNEIIHEVFDEYEILEYECPFCGEMMNENGAGGFGQRKNKQYQTRRDNYGFFIRTAWGTR